MFFLKEGFFKVVLEGMNDVSWGETFISKIAAF